MLEEQKKVGVPVNQAASMLEHPLIDLLSGMRSRAQAAAVAGSRAAEPLHDTLLPHGKFPQQISGRDGGG